MTWSAHSRCFEALSLRWMGAALCLVLAVGCTQRATLKPHAPTAHPTPSVAPTPGPKAKTQAPASRQPVPGSAGEAKKAAKPSPAVAALMTDADKAKQAGQLDNAAATLERAIRMQPRNPELWYRLAEIRMEQNQPRLALDLARKSKVLAKGNPDLIQKNQALIQAAGQVGGKTEQ